MLAGRLLLIVESAMNIGRWRALPDKLLGVGGVAGGAALMANYTGLEAPTRRHALASSRYETPDDAEEGVARSDSTRYISRVKDGARSPARCLPGRVGGFGGNCWLRLISL